MAEKILIVEEDRPMRRSLSRLLEDHGYSPHAVGTGEQALQRGTRERFDLIILDVEIGGPGGWETLRRLRLEAPTASIPVVVLTAAGGTDELLRAYASGAAYTMTKPCRSDELLRGLRLALHDRGEAHEHSRAR